MTINITGILKAPQGAAIQNAEILFEQNKTSSEVIAGTNYSLITSATGAYNTTIGIGTFTIKVRFQTDTQYRTIASNVIIVSSMNNYSLNQILLEQTQMEDVDYDLLTQVIQARDQQAASQAQAQTSETNAKTSETNALASKNAAQTSQTNAAASATQANTSKTQAAASATAAQTSQTNAANSATAAQTSQTNASNSATAAQGSASAAQSSQSTQGTKASEAAQSAASAQTSKDQAQVSETNAASSAAQALASKNAAQTSETNAAASAAQALSSKNAAQTSQTNAATSASQALASKNAAQTSQTNAATSETNAKASETQAQSSASTASTQATSATDSQSTATTKATEAQNSAAQALTSKNAAQTSQTNAGNSATAAQGSATTASTKAGEASTSQTNAAASASTATTKAGEASTSQTNAASSATLAQKWAANPENTPVSGGLYSALHYAAKAAQAAQTANGQLIWRGGWSAQAGNAPPTPSGTTADFYRITQAGTILGVAYDIGDYIHWDNINSIWFKMDGTDSVTSVNGLSGQVVLDYSSVGAAPAGFGLGGVGKSLANLSCDTATESGFYQIYGTTTETPISPGPSGSTMVVCKWGTNGITQTFYSYTSDRVWVRRMNQGVWQPWFELYSTAKKPTAQELDVLSINGGTLLGNLGIDKSQTQSDAYLFLAAQQANSPIIYFRTGSSNRWAIFRNGSDSESTGDVGSTLCINAYKNDGTYKGRVLTLKRDNLTATFEKIPVVNSQQDTSANQLARVDYVDNSVAQAGQKDVVVPAPAGVTAGNYYPILINNPTNDQSVYVTTQGGSQSLPMNNCSFDGIVRSGGWGDKGTYVEGRFTIYSSSERALHSILVPTENSNSYALYVEARQFPVTIRVQAGVQVTCTGLDIASGTTTFVAGVADPLTVVGSTNKVAIGQDFAKGSGQYIGINRYFHEGLVPTADQVFSSGQTVNSNSTLFQGTQFQYRQADGLYGIRLQVSNTVSYLQGGKTDSQAADQKLYLTGWMGNPLSGFKIYADQDIIHRKSGVDYKVYSEQNKPTSTDLNLYSKTDVDNQLQLKLNLSGGTLTNTLTGTRFVASDQYAFVSSSSQYQGMFLGTGTDMRTIIGGGDVASGVVHIRPRGMTTVTNETVFNNDGTITGGGTPTLGQHLVNKTYADTQNQLKLNLSGGTMTGAVIVANMKSAIKVDNQKSISLQDQANTMYHLIQEGNSFKIKYGNNADNPIFDVTGSQVATAVPFYSRTASIVQDNAGTKWIGMEIGASGDPYVSIKATGDSTNRVALTFSKGEILANTDTIAANTFRVATNGGLKFSTTSTYTGASWGMGLDPANGQFGIHRYLNNVWQQQPLIIYADNTVGINTLSAGSLAVTGNSNMAGSLNIDGGYIRLNRPGTNNLIEFHNPGTAATMIYMTGGGQLRFVTSNGAGGETQLRMAIETSGLVSAPDFQVTSDRSLKSDFKPITNALDKVDKLFGCTYFKKGKEVREAGLVAQDVNQVLPEATAIVDDYMTVSPTGTIALLVEAIKELRQELRQLKGDK